MGRHPGQRRRIGRAEAQNVVRHRQQRVQIERARQAAPDPGHCQGVVRLEAGAELPRQDAAAGDRQPPLARRRRHRQGEHVLLEAGDVEPPGDDPGATRRRGEVTDLRVGPAHRQMVVAPVRRPGTDRARIGRPTPAGSGRRRRRLRRVG